MSFLDLNGLNNDHNLSSSSSVSPLSNQERRVFSCNYCRRKFYSSQALGGHQNAHKIERNLAKKSRELSSVVRPHSGYVSQPVSKSAGSSHMNNHVQPPAMIVDHQDRVGRFMSAYDLGRGLDYYYYSYKGENVDEEDSSQLDLSLRL